ncbi:hypothetical protein NEOLEDRAFT_803428 [Neolentinus lepideus HHB14362 ss-1]|uniref:Uncharacterized protein n=1 Tax=Neolentinus lepideus HHB14362 ss-1 TaxID=1314782 RepID=A0A165PJ14_9AGAM|nr:hypothetical protein NEOLEDRAFT_803428 [Neolentinus lepideus HHB14362 ss-1]
MIITDAAEDTPKTTEAHLEAQRAGESAQQQAPPPQYSYDTPADMYSSPNLAQMHPQPAGRRFLEAFCVAIAIWLLLGVFTGSVYDMAHSRHGYGRHPSIEQDGNVGWPSHGDGTVDLCTSSAEWHQSGFQSFEQNTTSSYPKSVVTSFSLPSSSDLVYLVAHGSQLSGTLDVLDDGSERGVVKVDVTIYYYDDSALGRASICKLKRDEGQVGLGFFTPMRPGSPSWRDRIHMEVLVHFPAFPREGILHIPAFDTNLPMFSQRLGALESSVYFDWLALRSSNFPISSQSVRARNIRIQTSNSPIEGIFATDGYLALTTSNAHIQAQIGLYNDDGVNATELVLTTSNSNINSEISMHSTTSRHTGGAFKSTVNTRNGRIDLSHVDAPIDSLLDLTAQTSNSPATVNLHPTFEGAFALRTSNAQPAIEVGRGVPDPAHRGRDRQVRQSTRQRGALQGEVFWDENRRQTGSVSLASSNAPVRLYL